MKNWNITRILSAILAILGLLMLAAALNAQELALRSATTKADEGAKANRPPTEAAAEKSPAEEESEARTKADRDLGTAARTYERVYDRLSYGDHHLVEQLDTNKKRHEQLGRLLQVKKGERKRLEDRVADQLGRIRRVYPAGEGQEALSELAHEYESAKRDLESDIAAIQADLLFARERIMAIESQLRTIRARSISKGYSAGRRSMSTTAPVAPNVDARILADLEKLRRRVILRRVKGLADFQLLEFDPALCGREGELRTRLFRVMM